MSFEPWDRELRERAKREDCPIPEEFDRRVQVRLEQLPERTGGRRRRGRRRVVLIVAAVLALTACTAGAACVVLRQAQYRYFDSGEEAGEAATQASLEAGEDTAAVAYLNPGPIEDYPPLEPWDLGLFMGNMEQVYAHEYGGLEDGWTEMCAGGHSPTDRIYYKADALSGLSEFWPVETPDLEWLDETYTPPGGQCFLDWGSDFMPIASSLNFWGRYSSAEGAPVSLDWTFYREHGVDDTYTVLDGRYQVEEYTTGDGCTVTIEWVTSESGQRQFTAQYGYGYADFSLSGAELEAEEVYELLDHMNLPALAGYQPEPAE